MLRLAPISCSGETWIGSGSTPTTMSRPRTASPSIAGVDKTMALDAASHLGHSKDMEKSRAITALAALAQESRLDIFRVLVQAGAEGMPVGRIGDRLGGIPSATLSFHLNQLRQAGLVTFRREGRSLIYAAEYPTMNALLAYLTENCRGRDTVCAALCDPVASCSSATPNTTAA